MLFACFGEKTRVLVPKPKPNLVVLTKMGFLITPPTNQKQTQPNLAHPHVSLGSNRNTPVVKIEQNY